MTTRIVTDTVEQPDGDPWAGATVTFYLRPGATAEHATHPAYTASVTTNDDGEYAAELWCNAEGYDASEYLVVYPGNMTRTFILPAGEAPVSIRTLWAQQSVMEWSSMDLDATMDLYRDEFDAQLAAYDETPGTARLGLSAAAAATSVSLRTALASGMGDGSVYAIIGEGLTTCEVRRLTSTSGTTASFTTGLRWDHTNGEKVRLVYGLSALHAHWFGARASGSSADATQNTTAVNRALECASALASVKGQSLFVVELGPGVYCFNGPLYTDRSGRLRGAGPKQTTLRAVSGFNFPDGNTAMIVQRRDGVQIEYDNGGGTERLPLENIGLDGNNLYVAGVSTAIRADTLAPSTTRTTITTQVDEGATTLIFGSATSFDINHRITTRLDDGTMFIPRITDHPSGTTFTIDTPVPSGRTIPAGQLVNHAYEYPVTVGTADDFTVGMVVRLGTMFNTILDVDDVNDLIVLGERPTSTTLTGAALVEVTQAANGILCATQQPTKWDNVLLDNFPGYGVCCSISVDSTFENLEIIRSGIGLWLRGSSLIKIKSLNFEQCQHQLRADIIEDATGQDTASRWLDIDGLHVEGAQTADVAILDLEKAYSFSVKNVYVGAIDPHIKFLYVHGDSAGLSQIAPEWMIEKADLTAIDILAVHDTYRDQLRYAWRHYKGHMDLVIGQNVNNSSGIHAIEVLGINGRMVQIGVPQPTNQAGEYPATFVSKAASVGNAAHQPHYTFLGTDGTTAANMDANGNATAETLVLDGKMTALHYKGSGSAPSAALGAAAGTSPGAVTVTGTDTAWKVVLTTGTTPTTGTLFTLTFATAFTSIPFPGGFNYSTNAANAIAAGTAFDLVSISATQLVLAVRGTVLAAGTQYTFYGTVIE